MKWWDGPIGGFDLETTGVDVWEDRVVQYCVAITMPGHKPVIYSEYVNPGVPIPQGAIDKHGITDQYVQRYGNPPREALTRCVEELARLVMARRAIGGVNLPYDFTLLNNECARHGLPTVEERAGMPLAPVIDTYVLDKHADPYRRGSRKLDDSGNGPGLATHYGVTLVGAHDAVADTIASVEVGRAIGRKYSGEFDFGLYRLHAMQVGWRFEQCASLEHYFRYTKAPPDPAAMVDRCWPYCTDRNHHRKA